MNLNLFVYLEKKKKKKKGRRRRRRNMLICINRFKYILKTYINLLVFKKNSSVVVFFEKKNFLKIRSWKATNSILNSSFLMTDTRMDLE